MLRRMLTFALWVPGAIAQQGDRAGESQVLLPDTVDVPAANVRSPTEARSTFRVAPGFRLDLFASEPLIGDPVAACFDAAGRLWVVEMRGFMNDVDAREEHAPNGRVVVLEDRDHDGCADTATVFRAGLVLPRAVLPLRGGALVVEPPNLLWCADVDGDLRADGSRVVMGGFDSGLDNPEHAGNGLLWGLDHRIHLANDPRLLRWTPGGFVVETGAGGGQWGITYDDRGRFYFNYNEDWLRCDLLPGRYGPYAAAAGGLPGLNHRVCEDRTVWPIRRTPGVNRGYQPGRLVDYVLAIHTAVCGPHVYRGERLRGCDGDVFVCEPAGNLVRRVVLEDHDGLLRGRNPYEAERAEFLASTDERFRPVHLATGPDGALYVVDMYRGVIQHKNFVTTYLRQQILRRGLEQPTGLGRIWRIVSEDAIPAVPPQSLVDAPAAELVLALASATGTVRDLALRELVQRQERGVADSLRQVLRDHPRPACRIVMLSALSGLSALTATDLRHALQDADAGVLAFALQQAAPFLVAGDGHLWLAIEGSLLLAPPAVRWQLALTLGDVLVVAGGERFRERALSLLVRLVQAAPDDAMLHAVVGVAAHQHIVEVLRRLGSSLPVPEQAGLAAALRELARVATRSRIAALQQDLLEFTRARAAPWQRRALLLGTVDALPKGAGRAGWFLFDATPVALLAFLRGDDPECAQLANELLAAVALAGGAASPVVAELTDAERQRVTAGAQVFARTCAACHQLDGNGLAGLAPPLRDSEWVLGPPDRLARIVLHGVRGPIEVNGTPWNLEMPGQRYLVDAELAQVLSYVRRAFGHRAATLAPTDVVAVRAAHSQRQEPWTVEELLGSK